MRWQWLSSRLVIDDRWLRVRADRVRLASGAELEPFYVLEERDWVHVYALDEGGRLLLVRQYRYAGDALCSELPGGAVDDGETPLTAAQRELREETGYQARDWRAIGSMFANPARQTNRLHVFLASGLERVGEPALDAGEELSAFFAPAAEVPDMIRRGEFSQALHIASYFLARSTLAQA